MGLPCKLAGGNEERILQRYDALSTKSLSPVTKTFDHRMLLASTPLLGYQPHNRFLTKKRGRIIRPRTFLSIEDSSALGKESNYTG